jgi:hypothetical protein
MSMTCYTYELYLLCDTEDRLKVRVQDVQELMLVQNPSKGEH